jgi:hypothetical protein
VNKQMKHAVQVLNYEKRKLINRLYEMQQENDFGKANNTDEDFQAVKRKVSQTDGAIKLIESNLLKKPPTSPPPKIVS